VKRKDLLRPTGPSNSENLLPKAIPLDYQVRHEFFSFFLPHFPGAPKSGRPLVPRRADALRQGPVVFGRNRESRRREADGRRNLARSRAQGKCAAEKAYLPKSVRIAARGGLRRTNAATHSQRSDTRGSTRMPRHAGR
jgi:hypothetical protein